MTAGKVAGMLYRTFPGQHNVGWVVTIYWLASAVAPAGHAGATFPSAETAS